MEKANYSTILKLFDKSLNLLWPQSIQHESVLLFLSDAAPYMVKAAGAIKAFYSKTLHVTCLAHGLHLTAEEVRKCFSNLDNLISNVKKVFLKSPYGIAFFKNEVPELALPLEPILTRWGTWIHAAIYYCENIKQIRSIVNQLNPDDAISIQMAQDVLLDKSLDASLTYYIKSNFGFLPETINSLEKSGLSLNDCFQLLLFYYVSKHHDIQNI